ncbi:MAG: hypothetical protein ABSC41_19355 [Acidimicrobiales bacterium]|jgi:NifB/MoaA-like Fe-S oxidoreductase
MPKVPPAAELVTVMIFERTSEGSRRHITRRLKVGKKPVPIEDVPERELILVWNSGPTDVEILNEEGERLSKLSSTEGSDFVCYPTQRERIVARVVA